MGKKGELDAENERIKIEQKLIELEKKD